MNFLVVLPTLAASVVAFLIGGLLAYLIDLAAPVYRQRKSSWRPVCPDDELVARILSLCDSQQLKEVFSIRDDLRTAGQQYGGYGKKLDRESYLLLAYFAPLAVGRWIFSGGWLPFGLFLLALVGSFWWFHFRQAAHIVCESELPPFPPAPREFEDPDAFLQYWEPIRDTCCRQANARIDFYEKDIRLARAAFALLVIAAALLVFVR